MNRSRMSKVRSETLCQRPECLFLLPWTEFINKVLSETTHELKERLNVIELANELFKSVNHFSELAEDQRKFIAGIPNKLKLKDKRAKRGGYFGSMKGRGDFRKKIKKNDKNVSKALDQIPLRGRITKRHYDNFIKYFTKTFTGNYIATATRLLCMKRPDTFVCLTSRNRSALCKDFNIQLGMDYERYWDDIIESIYVSNWWKNPTPKNDTEEKISKARAAFLDSLYYRKPNR